MEKIESLKSLYIEMFFDDQLISSGTGFLVMNNLNTLYFVTARHNVTGCDNINGKYISETLAVPNKIKTKFPVVKENKIHYIKNCTIDLIDSKGQTTWNEHTKFKGLIDVAAIRLNDIHNEFVNICYPIDLKEDHRKILREVYIVGYPFGKSVSNGDLSTAIWSKGIIANETDFLINISDKGIPLPAFYVDSKTREGQSGSPVIVHGQIISTSNSISISKQSRTFPVGIYTGRVNKDSDLGIAWNWEVLKDICK